MARKNKKGKMSRSLVMRQKRRKDLTLTREVADALADKLFKEGKLFTKDHRIPIELYLPKSKKHIKLNQFTVKGWISKDLVIPETATTLRDFLNKVREDYRKSKREERILDMLEQAERNLYRVTKLRTSEPIYAKKKIKRVEEGQMIEEEVVEPVRDEQGNIIRKQNERLLGIQVDVSKFLAKVLDPAHYQEVQRSENKHLVISLSELRKRESEKNDPQN